MLFIKETNERAIRDNLGQLKFEYKVKKVGDYLYAIANVDDVADKASWIDSATNSVHNPECKKVLWTFQKPTHFIHKDGEIRTDLNIRVVYVKSYDYDNGDGFDRENVDYAYQDIPEDASDVRFERDYFLEHKDAGYCSNVNRDLIHTYDWNVIVAHKPLNGADVIDQLPLMKKVHDEFNFDEVSKYYSGTFLATASKKDGYNNYIVCPSFEHGYYSTLKSAQ
jgi:hypothetical protein